MPSERVETATKEASIRFEWVHRRTDGRYFPAEVLLNAIELNGRGVLQAVVREITERKRAEEKLRDTVEEMKPVNRLMTRREERVVEMKKEVNSLLAELQ